MRRYISPVGFSPHLVTRPIIADGISTGDRVEIIRPAQPDQASEQRAKSAIDDIRATLSGVVNNVETEVLVIDETEFNAGINQCSSLIIDGQPPVVCLGAGATDIRLPLTVAAIAHSEHVAATMMYSDLNQTAHEIKLPPLTSDFPGRARKTFQSLAEIESGEKVGLAKITEATDVDRTTVSRHVQALEKGGFVTTSQKQKEKIVSLTVLGRLIS